MLVAVNMRGIRPGWGGGEEVFLRRAMSKISAIQKGTCFLVLADESNRDSFEDVDTYCCTSEEDVSRALTLRNPEVLFTPMHTAPTHVSVPYVLLVMELYTLAKAGKAKRIFGSSRAKAARDLAAAAAAVVVPSDFLKREALEVLGVPLNKIVVAPLGVDEAFGQPQNCIVERPYFLAVGRMAERRNLPLLLDAFERISHELPHSLVVVGRPSEEEPEDWGPRVVRIDRVGTRQLAGLYQHCDLFICPSTYEGSGVLVLEALKAGACVATGRVGGITEVAGDAPIFFNPESVDSLVYAMRRAVSETEVERERRHRSSKQVTHECTWERTAQQTLAAFRRAIP